MAFLPVRLRVRLLKEAVRYSLGVDRLVLTISASAPHASTIIRQYTLKAIANTSAFLRRSVTPPPKHHRAKPWLRPPLLLLPLLLLLLRYTQYFPYHERPQMFDVRWFQSSVRLTEVVTAVQTPVGDMVCIAGTMVRCYVLVHVALWSQDVDHKMLSVTQHPHNKLQTSERAHVR